MGSPLVVPLEDLGGDADRDLARGLPANGEANGALHPVQLRPGPLLDVPIGADGGEVFLTGLAALKLEPDRIPALADVSRKLSAATNWQIARTPGLLDAHDFFSYLARRIFPCTDYIRARSELDYTPAPDCFHDIFGHTPMIMHPRFANFYQKIGQAALACKDPAVEEGLTRIYWFTVEFGLIRNPGGLRIYGNGIISSSGETQHSLTDKVKKVPYRPETLAAQAYDIWHFQDTLFVIESFDQLEQEFVRWARDHQLL